MSRQQLRYGFVAGILAYVPAAALLYLLSKLRLSSFVPLDVANTIIELTPGDVATQTIESLGEWGKRLLTIGSLVGFILAGGLLGVLFAWLMRRRAADQGWSGWALPGVALGLPPLALTLPLQLVVMANRAALPAGPLPPLMLGATYVAAGVALALFYRQLLLIAPTEQQPAPTTRRAFLLKSGGAIISLALGGTALARLLPEAMPEGAGSLLPTPAPAPATPTQAPAPPSATSAPAATERAAATAVPSPTPLPAFEIAAGTRPEITSQDTLYVISSASRDPMLEAEGWQLKIHGAVGSPYSLSYAELLALPRQDQTSTLECISNEVGNLLIGTPNWNGVRLSALLERAGLEDGVVDVVLRAAEGYSDSIPLAKALEPTTIIAYGIDGEALQVRHGFPARLIVPGLYGEKNVKWLTEIELVRHDYQGYWQQRGWTDDATIFTTSVFDTGNPHLGSAQLRRTNGLVALGGIAFAGNRGIRKVELRIDDGEWREARLKESSSDMVWRIWRYDWQATPGNYRLTIRAVDGAGELQTEQVRDTHPDGATGYHSVEVEVVDA